MNKVEFSFDLKKLNSLLNKYPEVAAKAAEKGLAIAGMDLQGKAQKLAPKDLADLRGSAYTNVSGKDYTVNAGNDSDPSSERVPQIKGEKMEAIVGFTEPYALRQHEHLEYRHTEGEAKYLEKPYLANKEKYVKGVGEDVANALMEEAFKGGGTT